MDFHAPASTPELKRALDREVEIRFGQFGGIERRGATPVSDFESEVEIRAARDGSNALTVKGYSAVFNSLSLEIPLPTGETFRERIAPGAFDLALAKPTVRYLLLNHERQQILGSSDAIDPESLELRVDPKGLRFFSRVVDTSYSRDLKSLMEAGIVRQCSFGFTVMPDGQTWEERGGILLRTITEVDELFEVTICARGAYPQTVAAAVAQRALDFAKDTGRLTLVADSDDEARISPSDASSSAENDDPSVLGSSVVKADPSDAVTALSVGSRSQDTRTELARSLRERLESQKTDFQKGKKP